MSRLADTRYSAEWWVEFRERLDAWFTLGGFPALARKFGVKNERVLHRWRLGITTPSMSKALEIDAWMRARVGGAV